MQFYKNILNDLNQFNELKDSIDKNKLPAILSGVSHINKTHFIYTMSLYRKNNKILVLTPDERSARNIVDDINSMANNEIAFLYNSKDFIFKNLDTVSREYEYIRLGVLSRILDNDSIIIVCSVDAALQYTIPPKILKDKTKKIIKSSEIDMNTFISYLVDAGYTKRNQVDGVAQFSVRGGIIDYFSPNMPNPVRIEFWGDIIDTISYFDLDTQRRTEELDQFSVRGGIIDYFSPNMPNPVRIEFWGDIIDTISYFDLDTQRRTEELDKSTIIPVREAIIQDNATTIKKMKDMIVKLDGVDHYEKIKKDILHDIEKIENNLEISNIDKYFPIIYDKKYKLFDYFDDAIIFVDEYNDLKERASNYLWQHYEDIKILFEEGELYKGLDDFCIDFSKLASILDKYKIIYMENFIRNKLDLNIKSVININSIQNNAWNGNFKILCDDLKDYIARGYACIILSGTDKSAGVLADDLLESGIDAIYVKDIDNINAKKVYVLKGSISFGFEYPDVKIALITNSKVILKRKKLKKRIGEEVRSLSDLNIGDLVVHVSHGIGVFDGINKLDVHGIKKDYIKIKYAGSDILYVPVTQLDLVSRYIGPKEDNKIKLNKLNSGEWNKTRARVKKAVDDMADELIKLYADRLNTKGYAFSEDSELQKDFEAHFPYEETFDQLRCIDEIKNDMEKSSPMDRLLCGDVGFGKTEVALRAAFKCVLDGKQCAILCPTTILAWQHYKTTIDRIGKFPVNIELLSRFRTKKEQKEIIEKLVCGEIDIIIGTHRIVQKDIIFKDLGLAIIDEEQRFGVAHKERFKEMFKGVDVLTLSATPIPRTLNMAMSGIRDMSVIEEPPQDRHPIQTYVLEHNMSILIDVIKRELRRNGQVYYIHNRIETIESCANRILQLIPEIRIGVAHGRMSENELSEVWRSLVEKEIDILVCTTIIETGVDVANCNTLIIEDADKMGLSQLYQLRGRIGRSNRRAFAYFTFDAQKVLSEISTKRLSAIKEFTQFGSGFKIALRDLEIRGAGNILGARQHGHMEAVGYDMYLRLLSEAMSKQKGENIKINTTECLIDVRIDAHIPQHGHMEAVGYDMYLRLLSEAMSKQKGENIKINTTECLIDVRIDAHIPNNYISDVSQRIEVYRKIASIKNKTDGMDIVDELIDRFGNPPSSVQGLIDIALLRNTASMYGFYEINQKGDSIILYNDKIDMEVISYLMNQLKGRVMVNAGSKPYVVVKIKKDTLAIDTIKEIMKVLQDK